jgi:uncharacterized membrane protein YphA (DoxX/SURF4 family)
LYVTSEPRCIVAAGCRAYAASGRIAATAIPGKGEGPETKPFPTADSAVHSETEMATAALVARFALGGIFLLAGAAKLPRHDEFVHVVRRYEIGPPRLSELVARWLPLFEIVCGTLVLVGLATPLAAGAVAAALVVFSVAVTVNLLRGREIDCGCTGTSFAKKISWSLVARDVVLAAAAVVAAVAAPRVLALDQLLFGHTGALDTRDAVALLVATTAALTVVGIARESVAVRRLAAHA